MNTPTPRTDEWEAYCDECYYHFWRLRRKTERGWYDGFHIHTGEEAKGLCDLLNNLEAELTAVTEQRDSIDSMYHKVIKEVLGCDPIPACKREDDQLEPPWEVIARIREQRDRLVEACQYVVDSGGNFSDLLSGQRKCRQVLQSLNQPTINKTQI